MLGQISPGGDSGDHSPNRPIRIAVDAMGGDFAPNVNIDGSLQALRDCPFLQVILVGDTQLLNKRLLRRKKFQNPSLKSRLELVHSTEVIGMDDHPAEAIRKKRGSSIHVGLELVKAGRADAFLSAGNSGAVMAASLLVLGRLPGVERPAIIIRLPKATGFTIVLDVGANVDCRPSQLLQFAAMGQVYAEAIEKIEDARLGLLSNASENHKGNELTREADRLFRLNPHLNYIGYVEGFDLYRNTAEIIVCDGFIGNIVLKSAEGLVNACSSWFRNELKKDWLGLLGSFLLSNTFRKFRRTFDYLPYGAAPLLGIDGLVFIGHGRSPAVAIRNGILNAVKAAQEDFLSKITTKIEMGSLSTDKGDQS